MKAKSLALFVVPSLLLSSCTFLFGVKSYEKDINVYYIDRLDSERNLSSGYQTTVKARFVSGQDHVPYLTLSQYASLYEKHFASNVTSKIEKSSFDVAWTIEREDNGEKVPVFVCAINYFTSEIVVAGSISSGYASGDDPRDLEALNYGMKSETTGKYLTDKTYATFKYSGYGFTHFNSNNDHYYPLGLLDITLSDSSNIYFTYNYSHILSTRDVDNYATVQYVDNGQTYTFNSQMESNKPADTIPSYLRDYNSHLFLYLMDHFYGLKGQKGISSMAKYFKNQGVYSNLFSSEDITRTWAFADGLAMLDDNHTALVSVNKTWGDPNYSLIRRYGEKCKARSETSGTLKRYRDAMYESIHAAPESDIIYSQDGKTAFFSFDSFKFGSSKQVFNEDKSIKDTAKNFDSFFMLIDAFNRMKAAGTVENVILDISLNGGGTVGIMIKLLALISEDNYGYVCFYDDTSSQVAEYKAKVDINNDKQYDTSDCFGDDFNFYILTSDCSFSCGNAFPCVAQIKKSAKIIGQKSGGGECAVSIHYLPNSEYVYHSSNLHLGYFNEQENKFTGFENGATPDIELPINANFYSIETLNTAITNAQ